MKDILAIGEIDLEWKKSDYIHAHTTLRLGRNLKNRQIRTEKTRERGTLSYGTDVETTHSTRLGHCNKYNTVSTDVPQVGSAVKKHQQTRDA